MLYARLFSFGTGDLATEKYCGNSTRVRDISVPDYQRPHFLHCTFARL